MALYKKTLKLLLVCLFIESLTACVESVKPSELEPLTLKQQQLIGKIWVYNALIVDNRGSRGIATQATPQMEPLCGSVLSFANLINKRKIRYTRDGTYEILWDPQGEYQLGTSGDLNWQPSFGSYQMNTQGTRIVHNLNQDSEVIYNEVSISEDLFERSSRRVMSLDSSPSCNQFQYQKGDTVIFIEQFVSTDF